MSYRYILSPAPQTRRTLYKSNHLGAAGVVNCAVADGDGTLYVGTDKGVLFLNGERFVKISGYDGPVAAMAAAGTSVYACTGRGTYRLSQGRYSAFFPLDADPADAACDAQGNLLLLTPGALYRLTAEGFVLLDGIGFGDARGLAVRPDGDVYVVCRHAVLRRYGKRPRWGTMLPSMTGAPDAELTCIAADPAGMLWVGSEKGVYVFDGRSEWLPPAEFSFFPRCEITRLAFGENGALLIGTPVGLYIADGEKTRFYGRGRYLAGDRVECIAASGGALWVGTEGGLVRLTRQLMPLSEKEAYYDAMNPAFLREGYYTKREGTRSGDLSDGRVTITDNDGLWTAVFVAAQCLKYAVTGSEAALGYARTSLRALIKLQKISGIPGFPARAVRRPGEDRYGDGDPEWHAASDETGPLEWKGETSSDELTGHYYALAWYFDLCADEAEKALIADCVRDMTDHILTHGYTLCDTDGEPTTWAHFGPYELNDDDSWCWEKGINSLELLTFLRIAYHVTGDGSYLEEQRRLAWDAHYAMNLATYKKDDAHSCHIDDRLGFLNITHLLRLETDEALLRYVKFALRRHYEYEKKEHNPYFDFVFAAALGCHTDVTEAVRSLEEYPLDLRCYPVCNSVRPDLPREPRAADFGEAPHTLEAIPVSERTTDLLSSNAFSLDSRRDESSVIAPTCWLLGYWYGRYAGLIGE